MPPLALTVLLLFGAYLLGSLSGGLLIGRLRGVGIRTQGSGNARATNAPRAQGARFALGGVAFDVAKGAIAAWLALRLAPHAGAISATAHGYAAAFAAAVGQVWPIWHGFRGGKGVAPLVGGVLILWPWIAPMLFVIWGATVMLGGYVGIATVLAGAMLVVFAWWFDADAPRTAFCVGAALLLAFTHRGNVGHLSGSESRFERARLLHRLWRRGR